VSSIDFPGARWRKSSYSNGQANCVETAAIGPDGRFVIVRDSKASAGPVLAFRPSTWRRFTTSVKAGREAL